MGFFEKYIEYLGVDSLNFASWLASFDNSSSKKDYRIELRDAELSDNFKKKYHVDHSGYGYLYINGNKVSDTLYRYGGLSSVKHLNKHKYEAIVKYVPAKYTAEEKKKFKEWKCSVGDYYLKETWVIIDTDSGEEMMEFGQFDMPYIHNNIAVHKRTYYYIPTREVILDNVYSSTIETETYIVISQDYQKSAVMVNKITGEKKEIK